MDYQKKLNRAYWSKLDICRDELHVTEDQLVDILRIVHSEFQSWKLNKEISFDRENSLARVLAFISIHNCLTSLFVNKDASAEWLLQVKPDNQSNYFRDRCPLEVIVQDRDGIFKALEYLRTIMRGN